MAKTAWKKPLPVVRGVGPSCLRLPDGPWKNILMYLTERFPDISPSIWITRMEKGEVVDESGLPIHTDSPYRRGAFVYYYRELPREMPIPFEERVVYRDDHILIADKPHFLPVIPSGRFLHETLLVRLKNRLKLDHLVPIHRLDRETAGIVVFSHNQESRKAYSLLFQQHKVEKVYEALAPTPPHIHFPIIRRSRIVQGEPFFRMKETEGAPNSETSIDVVKIIGDVTLYRLAPRTGRKHQLRVHCAALGFPILHDRFYPDLKSCEKDDFSNPLQLVARSVSFKDPVTGQNRLFESEILLQDILIQ